MNIKSLLLGSAAALATVSGAQAADAIVSAEPEPMEYVRVCDAFGTGYFYIPGTETCLKVSGYVRFDVRGGEQLGLDTDADGKGDTWDTRTRATLRISTASDTELGALKTYAETRWNFRQGNTGTSLNFAYIDLGGFRVGKDESAFLTFSGYAGSILNDDIIPFGGYDVNLISYTYSAGGFSAIVALEDDSTNHKSYMPNVVGGIGFKTDVIGVKVVGGYDDFAEEGAIKARVDGTFGDLSLFAMGGYNTGDVKNFYGNWGGEWAAWVGGSYKFNDMAKFNTQVSFDDAENIVAVANVNFTLAKGFVITPEVVYKDNTDLDDADRWGGVVRFQRTF